MVIIFFSERFSTRPRALSRVSTIVLWRMPILAKPIIVSVYMEKSEAVIIIFFTKFECNKFKSTFSNNSKS
jgi:hypothetical protein